MIRRATKYDSMGIAKIHIQSWQDAYKGIVTENYLKSLNVEARTKSWEKVIDLDGSQVWLDLDDDDKFRGFVGICPSRDKDAIISTGEIAAIYYSSEHWGQGFASNLFRRSITELINLEFDSITLWVLESNYRAIKFYSKHGFVQDGHTKTIKIGGANVGEIRMCLKNS